MPRTTDQIDADIAGLFRQRREAAQQEAAERAGRLIETRTVEHGKTVSRFHGDSRAAWAPFMPPVRTFITGFDRGGRDGRR